MNHYVISGSNSQAGTITLVDKLLTLVKLTVDLLKAADRYNKIILQG